MRTPYLAKFPEGSTMAYRQKSVAGQLRAGTMGVIDFLSRPMLMGALHNARHAIKAHEDMLAEMERVLGQIPPILPPAEASFPEIDLRDRLPQLTAPEKVLESAAAAR